MYAAENKHTFYFTVCVTLVTLFILNRQVESDVLENIVLVWPPRHDCRCSHSSQEPPCDDEDDEGLARRVVSVWLRAFYPTKPSIGIKM